MRRMVKSLSLIGIVALAACGAQQPLPSKSDRIEYLRSKGITVEEPVNEIGQELHFPFGRCNVKFYYTGTSRDIPGLDVYYDRSYAIEQFIGDANVGNAGKNANTMFCLRRDVPVPNESE